LRVEYRNGAMTGYGQISLSIKICWCFTLRVEESIRLPFASQGGSGARALAPKPRPTVQAAVTAHFANLDL
ncbi:MAG TPA: hypothetical protein VIE43_00970, partial [Thermoanaerobaculia bacterium]|nr:hypothetical protein [Thermoanaerobaculia bacterium]